ncbi:MAG: hypothetical protein KDK03_06800 [Rhodobacteraceae bacterium]|nr:hypothetical protein [Paracoccaceae bacterium]
MRVVPLQRGQGREKAPVGIMPLQRVSAMVYEMLAVSLVVVLPSPRDFTV